MALTVRRHDTVDAFLGAAGAFLVAREAEHCLILGVASQVRDQPEIFTEGPPSFATVHATDGGIVAATLRTPPRNQVLSQVDAPDAVDALVELLRSEPLPGVIGSPDAAARVAERWTAATGASARRLMAERIFRLERVVPPARLASGSWRLARAGDRDLLMDWLVAFHDEATPESPALNDVGVVVDRWIARRHRRLYLWEDGGRVVSLAGVGGETPNGIRIGPVYTPPELRGRGYASAVTAAASQDQLDAGRRFCFLFTDLANPTSNRIYRAVGYQPVCDVDMYAFGTDA